MRKFYFLFFILIISTGCATQRIPFPVEEFAGLNLNGNKTLNGTVFLIDHLEEKQVGSGIEVTLEPVTSYSNQWHEVRVMQNKSIEKADPQYGKYIKRSKTDAKGNFSFTGIAPGEYFITGPMFWEAVTCSANAVKTPVMIVKKITIMENDSVLEIPLTKEYVSPVVVCDLYTQGDWQKEDEF